MTVGFGIAPNLLTFSKKKSARGLSCRMITAGGELHPALKDIVVQRIDFSEGSQILLRPRQGVPTKN